MATAVQDLGRSSKKLSHGDRVDSVVSRESLLSEPKEIANSWRRCQVDYRVDAKSRSTPHVVTQGELKASQEPVANMLVQAQDEMDRLYAVVRQQAYVVLLCNSDGIAVHHRGEEARAEEFKHWGIWLGGVWSEQAEGTNGIGTCIKSMPPRELVEVIRQVYAGKKRIPLQVAARLAEHISDEALTDRETEVLGQIAGGSRNRDIAEKLFITEGTVKAHIKHIMHKLGARDRTQAVAIGLRRGIIQL